jgi:para-aminobenzoate synthetase/4-amino-4-deoxychorismate lyase
MGYYTPVTTSTPPVRLRFDFVGDAPRTFINPLRVVQATHPAEVVPALREVQEASEAGFYAAGYVTYEAASAFDTALTTHPASGQPLLWFGIFEQAEAPEPSAASAAPLENWTLDTAEADYRAAITTIRENIAAGVTYQTNYTVRLKSPDTHPDPYALFETLRQRHRPPYSSFLATGDTTIVSLSPELFFAVKGKRITTRPMKGTAPRGRFPEEDERLKEALKRSPKERAENVMIVDLLRNDLGKLACLGSVRVPELLTLETYPTFHTLTSTVTAELPSDTGLPELFRALFPCGSVTGAPKVSTMRLIQRLEPTPRGVYCGAIGYLRPGGDAHFSVPIRTLVLSQDGAEYGVGSGVTWDSKAETEYHELAVKAALVITSQADFSLLETLLWDGKRYKRLERHLARASASARFFGVGLDCDDLKRQLVAHGFEHPDTPRRIRALVSQTGRVHVESSPFTLSDEPLTVALAKAPVDSRDVFLFHKTTQRGVYDLRRQDALEADDVLLWNGRGELTEFTIGNLVLELDGVLLTPPREAGLLAGVMRQEGLESGLLRERTLYPENLARASRIWRINSLRGWQEVRKSIMSKITDAYPDTLTIL